MARPPRTGSAPHGNRADRPLADVMSDALDEQPPVRSVTRTIVSRIEAGLVEVLVHAEPVRPVDAAT